MNSKYVRFAVLFLIGISCISVNAQTRKKDKASYSEKPESYYWKTIVPALEKYEKKQEPRPASKPSFRMDFSNRDLPTDPDKYEQIWHNDPVSQGRTGTCWCYSTSSFYESEIKRLSGNEVKLSEMYTVYWEYVERARYFVKNRGDMYFGEGSETNAVARMMEKYGIVPYDAYTGIPADQPFPNHKPMYEELDKYLKSVKERNAWNEKEVVSTVQSILNHYLGEPPTEITIDGKKMTPLEYMEDELKLHPEDYVNVMSLMKYPYWENAEYDVPDNWWNSADYVNVPLEDFMQGLVNAVNNGYGVSIGGDVSETGLDRDAQVAVIPTFDIPSEYIDESARQFRFNNGTTTDDHAMHVVGIKEHQGDTWFLVKDSGSGSRSCGEGCKSFGYYFFHEDYVKLKMMTYTIHKDALKDMLEKMKG